MSPKGLVGLNIAWRTALSCAEAIFPVSAGRDGKCGKSGHLNYNWVENSSSPNFYHFHQPIKEGGGSRGGLCAHLYLVNTKMQARANMLQCLVWRWQRQTEWKCPLTFSFSCFCSMQCWKCFHMMPTHSFITPTDSHVSVKNEKVKYGKQWLSRKQWQVLKAFLAVNKKRIMNKLW